MSDIKLGQLITDPSQPRDAVHVAIIPVIAAENLTPGQGVGLIKGSTTHVGQMASPWLGIVDPFLKRYVPKGERCWLFLYPNTITSLRHDWTHPAFEAVPTPAPDSDSVRRIKRIAVNLGVEYSELMEAAKNWIECGDYWYGGVDPEDEDSTRFSGGEYLPDEFWEHYQKATGQTVPEEKQESFFTCSC